MQKLIRLAAFCALLFVSQAHADTKYMSEPVSPGIFRELQQSPASVKVMKVIDPLTFVGDDKNVYALSGIEIPNAQTGKDDITLEATNALADLIENKDLIIYMTKKNDKGRLNRMNQKIVQAETRQEHIWVEGEMLAKGLARVRTTPSNPEMIMEMLKLEQKARDAKRGLWSNDNLQVLTPDTVAGHENSFAIIQGTAKAAAVTRNMIFLNFSDDYRKDFTVGIPTNLRIVFARKNINVAQLAHIEMRVRGWVQSYNGPFIEIDHPEQIEILAHLPVFTSSLPQDEPSPNAAGMRTIAAPKVPEIKAPDKPEIKSPKKENAARSPNP